MLLVVLHLHDHMVNKVLNHNVSFLQRVFFRFHDHGGPWPGSDALYTAVLFLSAVPNNKVYDSAKSK